MVEGRKTILLFNKINYRRTLYVVVDKTCQQLLTQKLTQPKMAISLSGFKNNGHHSSGVEANYKKRKKYFCSREFNNLNSESQKRIMDSVVLYTDPKPQYIFASNRINRSIASCRSSKDLLHRYVQCFKK
jgi:hypothetical protein